MTKDTIEEDIMELITEKSKILDQILDGKSSEDINIFDELLKRLKGE
jgi:SNF2 family DNA or RNA helicase